MRWLFNVLLWLPGTGTLVYGQIDAFGYQREIQGVSETWHRIALPDEVLGKVRQDLSDLRIYGVTAAGDTIEAPYLLRSMDDQVSRRQVPFTLLNTVSNEKGYYYTFELPTPETVSEISLDFLKNNFDWKVTLSGSQDQNEWFTLLSQYRVLGVKNELASYRFTTLKFPQAQYRYFRIQVESDEDPELRGAGIESVNLTRGEYRNYAIKNRLITEDRSRRQTVIDLDLNSKVRLSNIRISVADSLDYYRPVTIKYAADSVQTENGIRYRYSTLVTGALSSLSANEFKFQGTTVQKIRIYIENHDNQALNIGEIGLSGPVQGLITRFAEKASYFLAYGNEMAGKPNYDLERFSAHVPEVLTELELGAEISTGKEGNLSVSPLFEHKAWLWGVMGMIIATLGWFSVRMLRSAQQEPESADQGSGL